MGGKKNKAYFDDDIPSSAVAGSEGSMLPPTPSIEGFWQRSLLAKIFSDTRQLRKCKLM